MGVPAWSCGVKNFGGVIRMLLMNTTLPRWSDEIKSHAFREDEKQALNGMICWILAKIAEAGGASVDYTLFPRIAIYRGFEKAAKKDIKEETYAAIIEEEPMMKEAISQYVKSLAEDLTSQEFVEHLRVDSNSLEFKLYRAATAIATDIEFEELKGFVYLPDDVLAGKEEIQRRRMAKYEGMKAFREFLGNEKLMALCRNFSKLRNQIRWVSNEPRIKFNDLGHSYHVACECYTMLLMEGYSEEVATKGYFVGLYHDLAERWTGDFPSPMKDAIWVERNGKKISLRDVTDRLERHVLEREVYCKLPLYMVEDFKGIMLEELSPAEKKLFKEADSFSAMIEARAEIMMGVEYFKRVYRKYSDSDDWSPIIKEWVSLQKEV